MPAAQAFVPSPEIYLQQTSLQAMEAMSVTDFAKLSPADRLAYYKAHAPNALIDTPSSDQSTQHPDYIAGGTWQPIKADALHTTDINVGKKMYLASLYYTIDKKSGGLSSGVQTALSDVESINGAGANDGFEYIDSGQWQHGIDENGKAIDFIDITVHQIRVIGGAEVPGSLQTYQAIREHIRTLDGQEYIMFFQGYTADGHNAPLPNYPY
ncbi:hypothetical protein OOZ51_00380 [Arthrobacter sp. MI7-26]|uniref:hypothetical protein n=1 Tax=Arthrobacter sp. MI7-26 TaxID=2993653 RepID=UPI00224946A9|nr:hypothetical protein [Arthrobacter sp. MI7-26]MCX2746269.1 hypothetical protein [Arthrobacter sp. MI7-26]